MNAVRWWPGAPRRLATRFALLSLLLLGLVQGAGFVAIQAGVDRNARASLAAELEVGERVWRRLLEQKSEMLLQGARVLAADYGFRSALGPGADAETLASALENLGARIGAGVVAWVDAGGSVRALHREGHAPGDDPAGAERLAVHAQALVRAAHDREIALVDGRPMQLVQVPVRAPALLGWVVMGFPVDQTLADDMRALSGLQVVLLAGNPAAPHRVATTLPLDATDLPDLAAGGDSLALAGEAMLLRSVDEAVARYRHLLWVLAGITLAGVAVFFAGSMVMARRVTTPLRALAEASDRLGRGDYAAPIEGRGRHDELGDLSRAFDLMRGNLDENRRRIDRLAFFDPLTSLPNRVRFHQAVEQAIEAEKAAGDQRRPLSVLMLDLDRFKHVNDVLGYAFGDQLLRAVAERLQAQALREGDVVARFAGDEFALLLRDSDCVKARAVAQRIARAFEQPLTLHDQTVDIAAGFGVACWPTHADGASALIGHAEVAMYEAKHGAKGGTDATVVYDPAIDAASALTLSLLSELRRAIGRDELRLFLQPKIEIASGRMHAAEALVRWQHPERGLVPPMQFIPFAEETGFVRQLTLWVFEETARHWPVMRALGIERVSVNLSTRDLLDQDLLAKLHERLARHDAPARAFCLEITEGAVMDEPERAKAMLHALADAGFKLSIDDFGTGQSSLAYLQALPVHELKIDKGFVQHMTQREGDAKIVRSTIDLAHNLGLSVVAEGVEDAGILARLREWQCDEAQGYFISRPVPAAELPAVAARWAALEQSAAVG